MDNLTSEQRHVLMSKIRTKNTTPEKIVGSAAHRLGFRFRLHRHDLPGTPDLVFPRSKKIILVNGCFWHKHKCRSLPKSNVCFWRNKLEGNVARDKQNIKLLKKRGWSVLVIWECQTKSLEKINRKILKYLSN